MGDTQPMFRQSTERFAEVLQGMKQMAAEMQTRARRHPHRTAPGHPRNAAGNRRDAAQMRRVIVDQIEALAELNRIVARHGREHRNRRAAPRAPEPRSTVIGGGRRHAPRRPGCRARQPQ